MKLLARYISVQSVISILAVCAVAGVMLVLSPTFAHAQIEKVHLDGKTYAYWPATGIALAWPTKTPEIIQRDPKDGQPYLTYSTSGGGKARFKAYADWKLTARDGSDMILGYTVGHFLASGAKLAEKAKAVEASGGQYRGLEISERRFGYVLEMELIARTLEANNPTVVFHMLPACSSAIILSGTVVGGDDDMPEVRKHLRSARFMGPVGGQRVAELLWLDLEYARYVISVNVGADVEGGAYPASIREQVAFSTNAIAKAKLPWDLLGQATKDRFKLRFRQLEIDRIMRSSVPIPGLSSPLYSLERSIEDHVVGRGGRIIEYTSDHRKGFNLVIAMDPGNHIFRISPDGVFDDRGQVLLDADRKRRKSLKRQ